MNPSSKDLKFEKKDLFSVPLTRQTHAIAQQFYQQQASPQQAKHIYLNTLAVCAVDYYLQCLGIETELERGDSWNPLVQTLADSADLVIKGQGKLECRPVLPHAAYCQIPPEVWSDRLGYIAVQLNPELTEAHLLGFVPRVSVENFPLDQLQSLETLIVRLSEPIAQQQVNLSQWLQGRVEEGWVAINTLLSPQQLNPVFRSSATVFEPTQGTDWLERVKPIYLEPLGKDLALCIALKPTDRTELDIWVDLYPVGSEDFLPPRLELAILDEQGTEAMQAKTQDENQRLQFHFLGHFGDRFSIRISLGEFRLTQPVIL